MGDECNCDAANEAGSAMTGPDIAAMSPTSTTPPSSPSSTASSASSAIGGIEDAADAMEADPTSKKIPAIALAAKFHVKEYQSKAPKDRGCCAGSYSFDHSTLRLVAKTHYEERCVAVGDRKKRDRIFSVLDLDHERVETRFCTNRSRTAHYTWWSFVPVNLMNQFRRAVNFYFLIALVMSFVIENPPVKPETWLGGFVFVIGVTMCKQGYEDYLRCGRDAIENSKLVTVMREGAPVTIQCHKIEVGDVVVLKNEEIVPCDMVILNTSNKLCQVYVETSNLDGEANLKVKKSAACTRGLKDFGSFDGFIVAENPSPSLTSFTAQV